jgi:hypothetical protein
MANYILYRDIAADDFLAALKLHREKGAQAHMPGDAHLRDAMFAGVCESRSAGETETHFLAIYLMNQYDMVRDETTAFAVLSTDRAGQKFLENTAKRLRIDLRGQGFDTLYRVDPRYGVVVGTARDAVDVAVRSDRNRCYITLVLTKDPAHPEASLLEYVDRDHQERYRNVFQEVNQTAPKKRGVMGFDLSKLRSGGLKGETESPFRHEHVRYFAGALRERYGMRDMKISLIYRDMTDDDLKRCVLDPAAGLFVPVGECRFFASTEELLA